MRLKRNPKPLGLGRKEHEVNIPGFSGSASEPEMLECIWNASLFNIISLPQNTEYFVKDPNLLNPLIHIQIEESPFTIIIFQSISEFSPFAWTKFSIDFDIFLYCNPPNLSECLNLPDG